MLSLFPLQLSSNWAFTYLCRCCEFAHCCQEEAVPSTAELVEGEGTCTCVLALWLEVLCQVVLSATKI